MTEIVWLHRPTIMSHEPVLREPVYGNAVPDWVPDNYQLWEVDGRLHLVTWCQECGYEVFAELSVCSWPRERGSRSHRVSP